MDSQEQQMHPELQDLLRRESSTVSSKLKDKGLKALFEIIRLGVF